MLLHVPVRRRVPRARQWWDPAISPAARDMRKPRDLASAAKKLRPMLEDALKTHLIADVPVGLFLSSGLDSGAIAALAAKAQSGIQSFTLTFPGTAYDEAKAAGVIAKRCGTHHTEVPLDGGAVVDRLNEALAALDQPTMDAVNTYFVSWAARKVGLKVALSGLGGDELFAGYSTFAYTPRLSRLIRTAWFVPTVARRWTKPLLAAQRWEPRFAGLRAQSSSRMGISRCPSPSLLLHAHTFSAGNVGKNYRAAIPAQHYRAGWRDARADVARMVATSR